MDDRLKETLSAMMDDEADELSVRRLLSREGQDEVRTQFQRWQQMRDLIQQRSPAVDAIDVSASVRDALDGHSRAGVKSATSLPPAKKRWQWSAVAMVTLALAVGFSAGTGWDYGTAPGDQPATAGVPEFAIQGMDEQQQEQLSRYLLQHAQHNSFSSGYASMGYARAASVSGTNY